MSTTPFLFKFAKPLPERSFPALRYDPQRQLSQALVNGAWVDALDADVAIVKDSTYTFVANETSDDK